MNWEQVARAAVEEHSAGQHPDELAWLLEIADREPHGCVVEIGSWRGGTLWAWKQLTPPNRVISVDIKQPDHLHGAEWVEGNSQDPATLLTVRAMCEQADFLFIDGDHTWPAAFTDFFMWWTLVRDGGLIGMHDVAQPDEGPEAVERAAQRWFVGRRVAGDRVMGTALFRKPGAGS